jgi:putative transposase
MKPFVRDPIYRNHRYPADVIARAVWLYYRFALSLRMVGDLMAERSVIVSRQTIRSRIEKFGRIYAHELRRRSRTSPERKRMQSVTS